MPGNLILRPLATTISCLLLVSIGQALIPQHNVFVDPSFWWEYLVIQDIPAGHTIAAMSFLINTAYFMNLPHFFTWKRWLLIWVVGVITYSIPYVTIYVLWVYGFSLRWPPPHFSGICISIAGIAMNVTIWFQFPLVWRNTQSFKIKAKFKFLFNNVIMLFILFFLLLWWVFTICDPIYQPLLSLILPIMREILGRVSAWFGMSIHNFIKSSKKHFFLYEFCNSSSIPVVITK